jgi:predicted DNA-binding protein (UPF0251 family)
MGARKSSAALRAIKLVVERGMSAHAAAIACNISPSAINRHIAKAKKALYAAPVPENNSQNINELDGVNYRSSDAEK